MIDDGMDRFEKSGLWNFLRFEQSFQKLLFGEILLLQHFVTVGNVFVELRTENVVFFEEILQDGWKTVALIDVVVVFASEQVADFTHERLQTDRPKSEESAGIV